MAATRIRDRIDPGKAIRSRSLIGTGTPFGTDFLNDDAEVPVWSDYTDETTGKTYLKSPGGWIDNQITPSPSPLP